MPADLKSMTNVAIFLRAVLERLNMRTYAYTDVEIFPILTRFRCTNMVVVFFLVPHAYTTGVAFSASPFSADHIGTFLKLI